MSNRWGFAVASAIGSDHVRNDLPCQDAHLCEVDEGADGEILIAAVADGAGSASHSDAGAEEACRSFAKVARELLQSQSDPALWPRETGLVIATAVHEAAVRLAEELAVGVRDLASTLVATVVGPSGAAFFQVGDGAMVTPADEEGIWAWIHWPHQGEYANTTTFVTHQVDLQEFQFDTTDHVVDEIAVFSDGLQHLVLRMAERAVQDVWFEKMMPPIRHRSEAGLYEDLATSLAAYLGSSIVSARTSDDITLILASRR